MPEPDKFDTAIEYDENTIVLTVDEHTKKFNQNHSTMNSCQLKICDDVVKAIENPEKEKNRLFFVDGPGGTGKTYLLEVYLIFNSFRIIIYLSLIFSRH